MIRLTWLQFRTQAVTAAAALAAFAVLLAATGPHLARRYATSGLSGCHGSSCTNLADYLAGSLIRSPYDVLWLLSTGVILLAPAVIGLFWGAPPIARELETGTAALAWNQSITRTRWLAVNLAAGALAAMALTEALSLMQTWWAAPISQAAADGASTGFVQSRFSQLIFASHGITPLGYAAFASALQVAMPLWIRPHFAPADRTVTATSPGNEAGGATGSGGTTLTLVATSLPGQPGAWILSSGPVNAAGQPVSTVPAACTASSVENNLPDFDGCLTSQGVREAISYQPASRYWPFQWTETAIYLALALALTGYCFRRLNHRLT
jgi:hypothetical protein